MAGIEQRTVVLNPSTGRAEAGYALLMAIFLVATLALAVTIATPTVYNQGQREKEAELQWRGKQYVRAIQLYYQKNGRYPQTIDDLMQTGADNVHYLRKEYRDPENGADGSWRFIYVAPSGQLIGSVKYHSLQEMAAMLGFGVQAPGLAAGAAGTGGAAAPNPGTAPAGTGGSTADTSAQPAGSQSGQQPGATSGQQTNPQPSSFGLPGLSGIGSATPASAGELGAVDGPVLGASLIGVASKVKRPSLGVYQGGKSGFRWEFIYNPLTVVTLGGTPQQPGAQTPAVAQPGQQPPAGQFQPGPAQPGSSFPNGMVPGQNPGGMQSPLQSSPGPNTPTQP